MPAASPVGFTDTLTVAGVFPLAGEAENHAAFDAVVNESAAPVAATLSGFDAGAEAPTTALNESEAGPTDNCDGSAMFKVTGTVAVVAPAAVSVNVPE